MAIRVVLSDDHPLILDALANLFSEQEDFQVVARCVNGAEALRAVREHRPDLLVVDMRMPQTGGLDVLRAMHQEALPTRTILLTAGADDDEVVEAIALGVWGVVLKEMAPAMLLLCARKVYAGEQWLEKRATGRLLEKLIRREAAGRELSRLLTSRELEVVELAAAGLRNKDIAEKLFLSEGTVKIHLHNIFGKVGVSSRAELSVFAQKRGLL